MVAVIGPRSGALLYLGVMGIDTTVTQSRREDSEVSLIAIWAGGGSGLLVDADFKPIGRQFHFCGYSRLRNNPQT